jgi:DNA-binding transcriptional MerR regulator
MTATATIGTVARLAGVTARTLRHYDDIELLVPSERRHNGYRGYSDADLERLQQILAYRELGLSLDGIAGVLDDPATDVRTLNETRDRIRRHISRLERIASSLDAAVSASTNGTPMTPEERLAAFSGFDPEEHALEAEERWGSTPAYETASRRTDAYSAEDWRRQTDEANDINQQFLALVDAGIPADSEEAARLVDAHRSHVTEWFYECTPEIHAGLGVMYTKDPRFAARFETAGDGLAAYLSAAFAARYGS